MEIGELNESKKESNMKAKYFVGQKVFFYSRLYVLSNETTVVNNHTYKSFTKVMREGTVVRVIHMRNDTFRYKIRPTDQEKSLALFRDENHVFEEKVLKPSKYAVGNEVFILCERVHKVLCPYCDNHVVDKTISNICKAHITEITINKNGITYWLHKDLKGELGKINVRLNESCIYVSKREAIEALVEKLLEE